MDKTSAKNRKQVSGNAADAPDVNMYDDAERRKLLRKIGVIGAASVPAALVLLDPSKARAQANSNTMMAAE